MLRRFDQLRWERAILRQLENLPSSTTELYKVLLDECQKAYNEQELVFLKKFFVWLAYAKEPLPVGCAKKLSHFIAENCSINMGEELEYRCAR